MSLSSIVDRLRDAFDMLNRRDLGAPLANRAVTARARRTEIARPLDDVPALAKPGFAEEAIPWMGAVHRFALRLARGDEDHAADLVQETYLRAYRAWDSFDRGTNCRSWLFTVCKNVHLHARERAHVRRELNEADMDVNIDALHHEAAYEQAGRQGLDASAFDQLLDERVLAAIDALPDDYRDVVVLSDLGDLNYREVADVLRIPVGTVKSRLFRARRELQTALIDYAADAGLVRERSE